MFDSDESDDNVDDNFMDNFNNNFSNVRNPRKAKISCKKALQKSFNDDDSVDYEVPGHDSDNDPDFKYNNDNNSDESFNENNSDGKDNGDDVFSDDGFSVMSNMTNFKATLNMLNKTVGDTITFSQSDGKNILLQSPRKSASQRKLSKECLAIYGLVQQHLWDKNYEEASEICCRIMKEHPMFSGSYYMLGQISEAKGDIRKANQLYYTSLMLNPKDVDRWITCIENTKELDGINEAIDAAKLAVSRTQNQELRMILINLLKKGGYEKESLKKKLIYLQHSVYDANTAEKEAEELIYLSEKFESWNDQMRASECLEIINKKFPSNLTNDRLISLLKVLIKLKRYNKVLNISKNIEGVTINFTELTDSSELIYIDENIVDVEHKFDIIFAVLMSILHLKMPAVVLHKSFNKYMMQLKSCQTYYINLLLKLFDLGFYNIVLTNGKSILDQCDEKLVLLKLLGKTQDKLDLTDDALRTYDYIITEVDGKDSTVWELKANLLYKLKREQDAINVLAESQKFVSDQSEEVIGGKFTRRCKPTKESAQLLYKLCQLLHKEGRMDEYVKVAWRYIFIDSYDYFKVNKMKLFCEEMSFVKCNFYEITNNIWECIFRITNGKSNEKSLLFQSSHAHSPHESEAWTVMQTLLDLLISSYQENMILIEVLAHWGLVLQKFINWNVSKREKLSTIYISTSIINRIHNIDLRCQPSTNMILAELRNWRIKYSNNAQFWNIFNLYCRFSDRINSRYVLRSMDQTRDPYLLNILNSGVVTSNTTKLSLAVNNKIYFEHPENPQICLQLAITYLNAAVSRIYKDNIQPMELAIYFMYQYRSLRGDCQEVWYNMGRFYHRMSFYQYAIACYDKCLETPPVGETERERMITDLSREAAFNLVLIYKERNNKPMSEFLTQKYLTI